MPSGRSFAPCPASAGGARLSPLPLASHPVCSAPSTASPAGWQQAPRRSGPGQLCDPAHFTDPLLVYPALLPAVPAPCEKQPPAQSLPAGTAAAACPGSGGGAGLGQQQPALCSASRQPPRSCFTRGPALRSGPPAVNRVPASSQPGLAALGREVRTHRSAQRQLRRTARQDGVEAANTLFTGHNCSAGWGRERLCAALHGRCPGIPPKPGGWRGPEAALCSQGLAAPGSAPTPLSEGSEEQQRRKAEPAVTALSVPAGRADLPWEF